ncbi:MAG: hypothetical protein IH945_08560 [Armatimonadetes bacterium]|nr:hypothetical protein [Armatimonadota bacterium]
MMYDIKRRDKRVFLRELFRFGRVFMALVAVMFAGMFSFQLQWLIICGGAIAWIVYGAYAKSLKKRFVNRKFQLLWDACKDRLERFHDAMAESSKSGVPELQDLPKSVDRIGETLYVALRRADIVMDEVATSEGWLMATKGSGGPLSPDQKAQELYRLADKNIAEYRQNYQGVMAGVERTEAQAAVFTTTLDTLRMRMLGHRLTSGGPDLDHTEFLQAMTEARMQLDSIDKALDELELTPFPGLEESIGDGTPPPIPDDAKEKMREKGQD